MSTKNYVVIARFDNRTTERLSRLQLHLHAEGYIKTNSPWPPHITIAAYQGVDINALLQWVGEFVAGHSAFELVFSSLGVLPPGYEHPDTAVLFASPAPSKQLVDFYYAFHERLDDFCGNLGWRYSAKCVHPYPIHSTIGVVEVAQMQRAMEQILTQQIFGMAKIMALEVYTYPMELIQQFQLNQGN